MSQRVGVVLAGGRGERLGRPKAELALAGQNLAERAASVLWPLCDGVRISIREGATNPSERYPPVVDPPPAGRGPLVGIDAAFEATDNADLLVLACDYPFVDVGLLRRLLSHAAETDEVVMPTDVSGRDHPLVALWRRSAAAAVRRAVLEDRLKVRSLIAQLEVRRLGPRELRGIDLDRALWNVNWPEDLEALEQLAPPE